MSMQPPTYPLRDWYEEDFQRLGRAGTLSETRALLAGVERAPALCSTGKEAETAILKALQRYTTLPRPNENLLLQLTRVIILIQPAPARKTSMTRLRQQAVTRCIHCCHTLQKVQRHRPTKILLSNLLSQLSELRLLFTQIPASIRALATRRQPLYYTVRLAFLCLPVLDSAKIPSQETRKRITNFINTLYVTQRGGNIRRKNGNFSDNGKADVPLSMSRKMRALRAAEERAFCETRPAIPRLTRQLAMTGLRQRIPCPSPTAR